jgi:hypothetical protein
VRPAIEADLMLFFGAAAIHETASNLIPKVCISGPARSSLWLVRGRCCKTPSRTGKKKMGGRFHWNAVISGKATD